MPEDTRYYLSYNDRYCYYELKTKDGSTPTHVVAYTVSELAALVRQGLDLLPEAETFILYRELQAEVAPDEGRIIRHDHAEMSKALSKNVKAAEALGLGCGDDIMLGIAKWAREYRETEPGTDVVRRVAGALDAWRIARRGVGLSTDLRSLDKDEMEDLGERIARELRYSEAEALEIYRKLQAEVAPNDRRILDAARDVCAALNENQAAGRHLGLAPDPDMLLGRLLQIARWAREYREPQALHLSIVPDHVEVTVSGGVIQISVRDPASSAWVYLGADKAGKLGAELLALVKESEPGEKKGPEIRSGAESEFEPGPEDLKDALLEVLEGRLAGKWQLGVALLGDREEIAAAISSAINRRDDMWEKPLSAEDRAVLDWARQHVVVRERDRFARSRFLHLVDRLLSEPPRSTPDADNPEPTEAENLAERVANLERRATSNWTATRDTGSALCRRVEALERRIPTSADIAAAIDNEAARAVPALSRRLRTLEEARAVEPWPPSKEALQQLVGTEVIAATGPQFDRLRAGRRQDETTRAAVDKRVREIEERLDGAWAVIRRSMESADAAKLIEELVEKAVAPIRELVHEQLDKVLKAMEKTKDRVDGMLKAADLEPLKLLAVDHDDHEARLMAIEEHLRSDRRGERLKVDINRVDLVSGQLLPRKRTEDLKAQGLTDGMIEAVVNGEGAETEAEAALRVLRAQKKAIDSALIVADKMEVVENTLTRLDKMTRNEPCDDAVKLEVTSDRADPISGTPESPKDGQRTGRARRVTTPRRPEKADGAQEED